MFLLPTSARRHCGQVGPSSANDFPVRIGARQLQVDAPEADLHLRVLTRRKHPRVPPEQLLHLAGSCGGFLHRPGLRGIDFHRSSFNPAVRSNGPGFPTAGEGPNCPNTGVAAARTHIKKPNRGGTMRDCSHVSGVMQARRYLHPPRGVPLANELLRLDFGPTRIRGNPRSVPSPKSASLRRDARRFRAHKTGNLNLRDGSRFY